ncbi:MAG: OmpH family outer membrane protein [Deltaproteobacteria bacterium]|nr:OmpH family outer membrane protein [Deltaproteobacteria bacterium]
MKNAVLIVILVFLMSLMVGSVHAATFGYIDVQKVFLTYEKTKKAQEQIQKKEQKLQEEIATKQKQVEKEQSKGMSEADLRNLVSKFEKEIEPKRAEIIESQQKITQEIQTEIVKATDSAAKKMGIEIVLDKQVIITGGVDITDKVIELLNKK